MKQQVLLYQIRLRPAAEIIKNEISALVPAGLWVSTEHKGFKCTKKGTSLLFTFTAAFSWVLYGYLQLSSEFLSCLMSIDLYLCVSMVVYISVLNPFLRFEWDSISIVKAINLSIISDFNGTSKNEPIC